MQEVNEMRLNQYLSRAGVASRRKGDDMIAEGRVKVNGKVVTELGTKINPETATVEVDGTRVNLPVQYVYILLNKPRGYITSLDDPVDRPVVVDLLPASMPRVWPVGRLDWDSEGFLILTNDGTLTHRLTHPSYQIDKRYAVKVEGHINDDAPVVKQLREGIALEEGETAPAIVAVRGYTDKHTWLEFVIHEGRNRQIRRMCEAVGLQVLRLRRFAMGEVTIEGVSPGSYRPLLHEEVLSLYKEVGEKPPEESIPTKRQRLREKDRKEHGRPYDVRREAEADRPKRSHRPKSGQKSDGRRGGQEDRNRSDSRGRGRSDRRDGNRQDREGGRSERSGQRTSSDRNERGRRDRNERSDRNERGSSRRSGQDSKRSSRQGDGRSSRPDRNSRNDGRRSDTRKGGQGRPSNRGTNRNSNKDKR